MQSHFLCVWKLVSVLEIQVLVMTCSCKYTWEEASGESENSEINEVCNVRPKNQLSCAHLLLLNFNTGIVCRAHSQKLSSGQALKECNACRQSPSMCSKAINICRGWPKWPQCKTSYQVSCIIVHRLLMEMIFWD
jgi:hypothetical protein